MKIKAILIAIAAFLFLVPLTGFSQLEQLDTILQGKTTFAEVTQAVDEFLLTAPDTYEMEEFREHYLRWALYQSMYLGPEGEYVNITKRTLEAVKQLAPPDPGRSANGDWTFMGPSSTVTNNPSADLLGMGRVDRLAFHPSNANIIYAGTPAGGLWKTTNGGSTWACLTNFIPSLGISGIVVSHADANTIYVLTGDGDTYYPGTFLNAFGLVRLSAGVLVSHDAGVNWQQTGTLTTADFAGLRLIQHPTNASILFAATSNGLYKTTNGGDTWTRVINQKIYDVEFKPGTPSRVYASGQASFFYSTNTGDTWNNNSTFDYSLCGNGRVEIAVAPTYTSKVYLFAAPATGNTFCGFFVSTDSGLSFTRSTNSPNVLGNENGSGDQSSYDMGITVKPTTSLTVIVCGLVVYKSTNGGTSFSYSTTYRESGGNYIHPDIHYVAYNPLNNYLYAAGDGGVHVSTDDGVSWTDLYTGINTTQFYHIDDYDANQYVFLGGAQDNGVKYRSSNTFQYSHIYCCDGGDCSIDYSNPSRGFASVNTSIKYYTNFTTTSPSNVRSIDYFPQHELNTSNPDVLFYSYSSIYKYTASTNTSTTLSTTAHGFWALKTCPSNSARIYAAGGTTAYATTGGMYVSSDGGTSWTTISGNTGFPTSYPRISDIGVYPSNSPQVYVTFAGYTDGLKVLYSSNTGTSWSNITYDLPNVPAWSIEVDASNNVYVGTDVGVFYKSAGATSWEPFYNSLPNAPIADLAINTTASQLIAGTFGRGAWKTTLRETCPATYNITTNVSGTYFRSASSYITMNSDVIGGEGTYAVLRTPGYVNLLPGFQANADPGNKFLAYIGPCDDGIPPDYSGQFPIYPQELMPYENAYTRSMGTLEVPSTDSRQKQVVLRLFQDGNVRIIFTDSFGRDASDIAEFNGTKGNYTYMLDTSGKEPGTYYLYLIVNDKVDHLQEVEVF